MVVVCCPAVHLDEDRPQSHGLISHCTSLTDAAAPGVEHALPYVWLEMQGTKVAQSISPLTLEIVNKRPEVCVCVFQGCLEHMHTCIMHELYSGCWDRALARKLVVRCLFQKLAFE